MSHSNSTRGAISPQELGPFEPPPRYQFESEFAAPIPRPIPVEVRRGPFARSRRGDVLALVALSVFCLAFAVSPLGRNWAKYVLPLAYLDWVGIAVAVLAACLWTFQQFSRGHFRYIESGKPLVGRICNQALEAICVDDNGRQDDPRLPTDYVYKVEVEYRHPQTGELAWKSMTSAPVASNVRRNRTLSYRVGDYATLVYLENGGPVEETIQLYGLLGLRPEIGIIARETKWIDGNLKVALDIAAYAAGFALFMYAVTAVTGCIPEGLPPTLLLPALIGGAAVWTLGTGLIRERRYLARQRLDEFNAAAALAGEPTEQRVVGYWFATPFRKNLIGVGLFLAGAAASAGTAILANAWLDTSPPRYVPVKVVKRAATTSKLIFRSYEIEYRKKGGTRTRTYYPSYDEFEQFRGPFPVAVVRAGRFGMPWVERLEPDLPPGASLEQMQPTR